MTDPILSKVLLMFIFMILSLGLVLDLTTIYFRPRRAQSRALRLGTLAPRSAHNLKSSALRQSLSAIHGRLIQGRTRKHSK
jgi:hypothetical protein